MYRNPQVPSLKRRLGISITVGLAIALIGATIEAAVGNHPLLSAESIDDVIIGVLTAIVILVYEQHRYRVIMDKIRVISAMNHHVRNALQTISYSPYTEEDKQIRLIAQSVSRIEWALREVLPGESATGNNSPSAATLGTVMPPTPGNSEMAAGSR